MLFFRSVLTPAALAIMEEVATRLLSPPRGHVRRCGFCPHSFGRCYDWRGRKRNARRAGKVNTVPVLYRTVQKKETDRVESGAGAAASWLSKTRDIRLPYSQSATEMRTFSIHTTNATAAISGPAPAVCLCMYCVQSLEK